MPRMMLTDMYWERLSRLMKSTGRVYDKTEHRMTLEGILYRMRTGCPWRDLAIGTRFYNAYLTLSSCRISSVRIMDAWKITQTHSSTCFGRFEMSSL